jgi:hypothetical protein
VGDVESGRRSDFEVDRSVYERRLIGEVGTGQSRSVGTNQTKELMKRTD